jgi:hypothetical protein
MATFTSPGAAVSHALQQLLQQRAAERRQQMLDGIVLQDKMRERARQEAEMRRQAQRDAQADADRAASINGPDVDLDPKTAATLRAGGYRIEDKTTVPGRTLDGPMAVGRELPATPYSRRAETYPEQLTREQREREQRDAAKKEATRIAEREADQRRQDLRDKDAAARHYLDSELRRQERAADAARDERQHRESLAHARAIAGAKTKEPTQGQLTADSFYTRALDASEVLEDVEGTISQFNRYIPNFLQSEDGQSYEQAKRQFVEAYLRKDSGAAIADSEYANADKTYFVQPGDSSATVKRKQRARARILESLQHQGSTGGSNGRSRYKVSVE